MLSTVVALPNEAERIAAVRLFATHDTPDQAFDRITALAARRVGAPVALISIVDEDRVWFKSHHGLAIQEIDRAPGLCVSAIESTAPYVIADASRDARAIAHPLVSGEFGLRFYAGVPLRSSDGHALGTLCVIDRQARQIDQAHVDDLNDLAALVMDQFELKLSHRRAVARAAVMAKEVDHRVMNSLQFVSTFLTIQARSSTVGEAAAQLMQAANRVAAVAQVHRHFVSDDSATTCCTSFLRRLCGDLADVLGRSVEVRGDEDQVSASWVQPIGLLVTELVTNAAKHGEGLITVAFEREVDGYALTVTDQGPGFPEGFDPQARGVGLGMLVVRTLAKQLDGVLSAGSGAEGGASFKIAFARAEPLHFDL